MTNNAPSIGYPHFKTIAICVPWSGRPLPPELVVAFKSCLPPMNSNVISLESRSKPIDEARNWFAETAIEQGAKYIWFWDEDVLLPAHALRELMWVAENFPECGVVGGIYCLKTSRPEPMVFQGPGKGPDWNWKVGEIFECKGLSMGCTLIRTEIFKEISKPWFKTVDDWSQYLDNVPVAEVWTEDLWFTRKVVTETKWKIYAHGQLILPHVDIKTGERFTLPPDSKPARHMQLPVGKKKILDIAPGDAGKMKTNEGAVVSVDIRADVNPDYRCDFRKLPFASDEFDCVYSSHSLEHVPRAEVQTTLDEWVRVLKQDGELRLIVPNLEWAAKKILEGDLPEKMNGHVNAYDVLYGRQSYDEDFHKTGFTEGRLRALLKNRGFTFFVTDKPGHHIVMRAWKKKPKGPIGKINVFSSP